jgi:hypothetical protein
MYNIDIASQGPTLITTAWFSNQGKNIIGGHSKVLFDFSDSQFFIYSKTETLIFTNSILFIKLNHSEITSILIFKDNIPVIKFVGSYFYFSSLSGDQLK